jgi:hypothetical protein
MCGHYSRPDLLWLGVDDREKRHRVRDSMEENEKESKTELVEAEKARKP